MTPFPKFCAQCSEALVKKVPPQDSRERHVCPACGHVHYVQPKVAAGTIPERDGEIVLVKRGVEPRIGFWSFPCGFMEYDEDVPTTAKRETEEETGLEVELGGHLGTYSYADSPFGVSVIVVVYRSRVIGGELRPDDDVVDARYVKPDAIDWDELAFRSSRSALQDWIANHG